MAALVHAHPRLADLALSFPALLVALAHPRPQFDPAPAIAAVIAGRPLGEIAWLCGVPLWLRNLQPAMFHGPIPELPDSDGVRRAIVNCLPRETRQGQVWLETVSDASRDAHDAFAIWCARHVMYGHRTKLVPRLRLLSLWAWYSGAGGTNGHARIDTPWHPAMTVTGAVASAEKWRIELELHLNLAGRKIVNHWLRPAIVDGYAFVPLATEADIRDEARVMRNCLRTYSFDVACNYVRLWSIRRDGHRVASASVGRIRSQPVLSIAELKAAGNRQAPVEVWLAAQRWLVECGPSPEALAAIRAEKPAQLSSPAWRALWRPYWIAKGRIPDWLPLSPSRGALASL